MLIDPIDRYCTNLACANMVFKFKFRIYTLYDQSRDHLDRAKGRELAVYYTNIVLTTYRYANFERKFRELSYDIAEYQPMENVGHLRKAYR